MLTYVKLYFKLHMKINDSCIQSKAKSLAINELSSFKFVLSTFIWCDILHIMNFVSKQFQSKDTLIDVAMQEIKRLASYFRKYRGDGLRNAAREIADENDIY